MKVKIIYETQTGTTQYVAEIIQKELTKLGHTVDLHSIRYQGPSPDLNGYDAVLFGGPTYEDGKLENAMRVFIARFTADLSKLRVAVFGLGNSTYPQFCTAAKILEDWVITQQGKPVVPALKVDGFPDDTSAIQTWAQEFGKV